MNHVQLVYMSDIHLLMFGRLFPQAVGPREISQINFLTFRCVSDISWPWFTYTIAIMNALLSVCRI